MAARTMRILSASSRSGRTRWYPPSPIIETISSVWPSLRRGTSPMDSAPFANHDAPASTEAPVTTSRNCLLMASNVISLSRALGTRCLCRNLLRSQNLVEQKHVSEQCTQVHRSVHVVDQLRADRRLGQHEFDGGQRIASIAAQHGEEWRPRLAHRLSTPFRQSAES